MNTLINYKIEPNEIYSTKEVAELLKVKLYTVRKLIADGSIRSRWAGAGYKIYGQHIIDFINKEFIERGKDE